jgi:hypothetical protein
METGKTAPAFARLRRDQPDKLIPSPATSPLTSAVILEKSGYTSILVLWKCSL